MVTEPSTSSERMIERELMVTGEAVAVEIIPATVVNRIASGLIDYTVYSLGGALSPLVALVLLVGGDLEAALAENAAFISAVLALVALAWESSSPCSSSSSAGAGAWGAW